MEQSTFVVFEAAERHERHEAECLMLDRHGRETGEIRWMTQEERSEHIRTSAGDYFPTGNSRKRVWTTKITRAMTIRYAEIRHLRQKECNRRLGLMSVLNEGEVCHHAVGTAPGSFRPFRFFSDEALKVCLWGNNDYLENCSDF